MRLLILITFTTSFLLSCNEQNKSNKEANTVENSSQIDTAESNSFNKNSKSIRSIYQDKNGTFWFGTNSAGVYRYNKKTLKQFTTKDGLVDNQVLKIQEDNEGNIWLGTGVFGVNKFDGKNFTTYSNKVVNTKGTVNDWKAQTNNLWFYAGGGVMSYNNSQLNYLPFDQNSSPFTLSPFGVYCILKDTKGNIWFGTQAQGVCRYDGESLTWFTDFGLAGPAVLGLFEDSKGNIWMGNNGAGLFRYDGKTLVNFTAEKGLSNADFRASGKAGLGTMARVYAINEDTNGNIWIGTVDAGVWKYDGNNLVNYTIKDGLTSNAVNTIYRDNSGALWFGTDENGICKFNGTTFSEFSIK